jgi:hypothetical protein
MRGALRTSRDQGVSTLVSDDLAWPIDVRDRPNDRWDLDSVQRAHRPNDTLVGTQLLLWCLAFKLLC